MNDIVKTYQERFRRNRHNFRRYAALLLALAMITTLFVNWQLHGVGISMTADYQCGEIEHTHTADCYEKVLICPYTEGEPEGGTVAAEPTTEEPAADTGIAVYDAEPEYIFVPHEHTDACYTEVKTLTCSEEEHTHDDECFDPEDGSLICDQFSHPPDADCYTTERELTCGLEEGELVEELNPNYTPVAEFEAPVAQTPVVVEPAAETPVHHHTDACYEEVLVCPLPEHHHTVNCLSDQTADIEDEGEWLAATDTTLSDSWAENLIAVAKSQLGYEQSEKNFKLETDEYNDEVVRNYTRYGQWYGNPYGEWDVMFLSYCLHYAEIPQSAVPQKASVLALRSAMNDSGTSLLQDVDSRTVAVQDADSASADTTIAPGDIVIYSKNKMETVVWEQSEPTTDPSDSGIALYSSGFVPSGPVVADDDFVASTDPTPVYTTKTTTVETAGIVESVDSKLGIVNVISGDVDGKVDTVQLSLAQVQSVINVAKAQDMAEGNQSSGYLGFFDEITDHTKGGITKYTIAVGNQEYTNETVDLTNVDKVNIYFDYSIDANTLPDNYTLTYHLPDGLAPDAEVSTDIKDLNGHIIGKQTVYPTGITKLVFDPSKVERDKSLKGKFAYEWAVTRNGSSEEVTINFPGSSTTITLRKLQDIDVKKEVTGPEETTDGKTLIHYKVIVSSEHGWDRDDIFIQDNLSVTNSDTLNLIFTNFKLQKYKKDAQAGMDYPGFSAPKVNQNSTDKNKFNFKIENLKRLAAGEQYVLTYDIELKNLSGWGCHQFENEAKTNDNKGSGKQWATNVDHIYKDGSYDKDTDTITWKVTIINPTGADLNGSTITDLMDGITPEFVGDATLTVIQAHDGSYPNRVIDTFTPTLDAGTNSFTYKFDSTKSGMVGNTNHRKYELVYKTKVPAGQTRVTNNATYDRGDSKYTAGAGVDITDNQWNVKKTTADSSITDTGSKTSDGHKLYEAVWNIDVDMPKSITNNTITDIIDPGYSTSTGGRFEHYAYAKNLQDQFEKNLTITYNDAGIEKTLQYSELAKSGIVLTIKYYTNKDQTTAVNATDNTKKVQAFTIDIDTTACKLKLKHLHLPYTTLVEEVSSIAEGESVTIKNTAGNEAYYNYRKPKSDIDIKKGSWQVGRVANEWGNYGGTNENCEFSYDNCKYIGYQVILDLSSLDALPDMTFTDQLDSGLTFDEGSFSAVFGKYNSGDVYSCSKTPVTGGTTCSMKDLVKNSVTCDANNELTFSLKFATNNIDFATLKKAGYTNLVLRYSVSITDPRWSDSRTDKVVYQNTISYGDVVSNTATTTVRRYKDTLSKESEQIHNAADDESRVRYTVTLNPFSKDLVEGKGEGKDTLTLKDTLIVRDQNVQAKLDMDSVKLYAAPLDENSVPLQPGVDYSMKAPVEGVTAEGYRTYMLELTIPDEKALVLVYDYVTNAKTDVTLENKVSMTGGFSKDIFTDAHKVNISSVAYQAGLTVHKYNALSAQLPLSGVDFKLEEFVPSSASWESVYETLTTDTNGTIFFEFNEKTGLKPCTLYRLTEMKPLPGYMSSDDVYYFIYRDTLNKNVLDDNTAYAAAVEEKTTDSAGSALPERNAKNLYYYTNASSNNLYVSNVSNRLTIKKYWQDQSGLPVDGNNAPMESVTVKLYKHSKGTKADPAKDPCIDDNITLCKKDGWTYTYDNNGKGLDADMLYYIVEQISGIRYDVTYSNEEGVGAGGVLTVTNQDTGAQDYELPSTGGAGTTPFTAVGGTMMLTALVYGVRRKRRRKGGADD